MRTHLQLLVLIITMALPISILANVIVKGQVTYQNGQPASNYKIYLQTDSGSTVCQATHTVYTNPNGIYQDTFVCTAKIERVRVWIVDCQNSIINHDLVVTSSAGVVESNFIVCSYNACNASFTWYPITTDINTIRFHSENSSASPGDSIISRKWIYGDGDSATGNITAPDHRYANAGNYTVCLYTKTKYGCESHACNSVSIVSTLHTCHSAFAFYEISPTPTTSGYTLRFHNTASTFAAGDSIISCYWKFGDGSVLGGNVPNPSHSYPKAGSYTICLTIVTKSGCTDSSCQSIVVPPTKCHAQYTYLPVAGTTATFPYYIHFTGQPSTTSVGDSIIQYKWTFGDGATASTKDPYHSFTKAGSYLVCLTIVSKYGCTDSSCQSIVIPPVKCHAQFTYLPVAGITPNISSYIHFNGEPSTTVVGDSIIQYKWTFGDGGTASTKDPYHSYPKAGSYLVCLTIVSKYVCTDSVCANIVIAAPPITCSANFNFTDTGLNGHFYSSQIKISSGDSIISRNWTFGDGQTLAGNVVSPLHHYTQKGDYYACLKITTRLGCASEYCTTVYVVGESPISTTDFLKIISLYPNPATTQFSAIVYSRYSNVDVTLAIYDVYGTVKWSSKKVLSQGNNTISVPISQLLSGPYIFKATTIYGVDSKRFFKL